VQWKIQSTDHGYWTAAVSPRSLSLVVNAAVIPHLPRQTFTVHAIYRWYVRVLSYLGEPSNERHTMPIFCKQRVSLTAPVWSELNWGGTARRGGAGRANKAAGRRDAGWLCRYIAITAADEVAARTLPAR